MGGFFGWAWKWLVSLPIHIPLPRTQSPGHASLGNKVWLCVQGEENVDSVSSEHLL